MRNVILYIAMSLDGYIADGDGGVNWIGGDGSDPENHGSYDTFIETVGTVIFGYTTYNQIVTELAPGRWDYADKDCYVITHRNIENTNNISFTSEDISDLIRRLKREDGKKIWICGGADIARQLMRLDLIDEYCISVIPTLLGAGVRLFDKLPEQRRLRLMSARVGNGMVDLHYAR